MKMPENYGSSLCSQILDSTVEAVICFDINGSTVFINRAALSMVGSSDEAAILGRKIEEFFFTAGIRAGDPEGPGERIISAIFKGEAFFSPNEQLIKSDGELVAVSVNGRPLYSDTGEVSAAAVFIMDISSQKNLEDQLLKAQKMEALGTLAGGVAHDFNNILTAIIGFGTLMEMKMSPGDPMMQSLQQILSAADRASDLTRSILVFSRKELTDMRCTDMNRIIHGIEKLMRRLLRENISLSIDLCQEDLPVMADAGQIEQVLMNLAANAADAMPKGGKISVSTSKVVINEELARRTALSGTGEYLLLKFSDDGCGMDEATAARIFNPFFSTKPQGEGTGLGLSVCYGIIRKHNGQIECRSEKGVGTIFSIYLPVLPSISRDDSGEEAFLLSSLMGNETLLLAEDDQTVRTLNKRMFEQFGYRVIEASDGEEALHQYVQNRHNIALIILDVIMPFKGAVEVYERLRALEVDVPSIFISGYSGEYLKKQDIPPEVRVIKKPVAPVKFLEIVRSELDRRSDKK